MLIRFNKYQVYGKITFLIIFLSVIGLFIIVVPPLRVDVNTPVVIFIFLILMGFLIFCFAILMTLQLLFLPKGVNIDEGNRLITLTFFVSRPFTITPDDVANFSSILVHTKSTNYEGILLYLKNGKKYLLGDFNLKDYKPIRSFLEDYNVFYVGYEKFNFITYFVKYFK
jgi:hypothetical protein